MPNEKKNLHIDWEKATKTKVTVPLAVLLGFALVGFRINSWTVDYLSDFFLTTVAAGEISAAVQANAKAISGHINEYKINEAKKAITGLQDQIFELRQWVSVNGANVQTAQREDELGRRLTSWLAYRNCLVAGSINCANIHP